MANISMQLLKNKNLKIGSVYFIANIVNKAVAFLTLPIFTNLMTSSEYGTVSTYCSFVSILQYFMGFSSEYTLRNAFIEYEDDIPRYMSSMYVFSCFCSIIVSTIIILFSIFGIEITTLPICIFCLIQSFMTYVINAMCEKMMMEKKQFKRAVLLAGPSIVSVLLGIIFILFNDENAVIGRILGYTISYVLFGIVCLASVWKQVKPLAVKKYWIFILKISPPLIIQGLSMIALSQIDRIMLTSMRSSRETGIYSIIYSMSMVSQAVTQALQGMWTPWFTQKYKNKKYEEIDKQAVQYLRFAGLLIILIILVAPDILKFMVAEEYWSGIPMIPPLVVSSYLMYMYSFYIGLELHEKKTRMISFATAIAGISNVILNFIFIPKYGAIAASYTTMASYLILFLLHYKNVRKINSCVLGIRKFVAPFIAVCIAVIYFYITMDWFVLRWLGAVLFLAVIFLKFNLTKGVKK